MNVIHIGLMRRLEEQRKKVIYLLSKIDDDRRGHLMMIQVRLDSMIIEEHTRIKEQKFLIDRSATNDETVVMDIAA